ncbi:MAG: TetR/AcrR family transcriptional regulator [Deltaproteobacteria bacterium]|nr:TetR/AcrR family transcriptional regulator [Deltaproteobacteria bacterium]
MAPKIVDREMRRMEIAGAAGVLFGKYGFDKVTIDDVAEAAGIGKGTVYEYFKNKEELIHGAFEIMLSHMGTEIEKSVDLTLTPLEALKSSTYAMVDVLEHVGEQYGFFLEYMLLLNRGKGNLALLQNMFQEYRSMIAGLLEAGIDAHQVRSDIDTASVAAAFAAWLDGAIFHWMILPTPGMKTMATAFWDAFVQGVALKREE